MLGACQVETCCPPETKHVAHAEGLRRRGVRCIWELLPQLQVVQDQPVTVGAVCGLAIGGGGKVGADPGGSRGGRCTRPWATMPSGVNPVEVAAPVRGQETVGQADFGRRAGRCSAFAPSCGCPRRSLSSFSLGNHPDDGRLDGCGDVLTLCVDQRGAGEQLLAQEAERRSQS